MIIKTLGNKPVRFMRETASDDDYVTTRAAIRRAINKISNSPAKSYDVPIRVRRSSKRYRVAGYVQELDVTLAIYDNGRMLIGCCYFNAADAKRIQRWANRRSK